MTSEMIVLLFALGLSGLTATIVSAIAWALAWFGGMPATTATARAGVAFAATLTLAVVLINTLAAAR